MGRPVSDEPRDKTVCVRFTDAERREIEERVGPHDRSKLLRKVIMAWARDKTAE